MRDVGITVEEGDITTFVADAVVLKFARSFHGADLAVARTMSDAGVDITGIAPQPGATIQVEARGLGAKRVVYVGTPRLGILNYKEVGEIVRLGLASMADSKDIRHVAFTIHGPGIGLDETQSLLSMLQAL